MGPVSLVSCHQQMLDLSLLLQCWTGGGGWGPMDRLADVLECSWESLFLKSSGIRPNLLVTRERLLYADHVRYVWSRAICELSVENVLIRFPL
jgi:hypothetical protein